MHVYALFNDATHELFYVGLTQDPKQRYSCHKNGIAKDFKETCRMEILEEGDDVGTAEEFFWIEYMRFIGAALKNRRVRQYLPRPGALNTVCDSRINVGVPARTNSLLDALSRELNMKPGVVIFTALDMLAEQQKAKG